MNIRFAFKKILSHKIKKERMKIFTILVAFLNLINHICPITCTGRKNLYFFLNKKRTKNSYLFF
jgi:hypothetical protein